MKIAIFFTYNYKLETLIDTGLINRELKIYKELSKIYGLNFIFLTYDTEIDDEIDNEFNFIPIYKYIKKSNNSFLRFLKSFFIPFVIKNKIRDIDLIHQHQLMGSWIVLLLKFILKKPLLIRTGYDAFQFSILNKDSKAKIIFYKYLTKVSIYFSDLYTVTSNSDLIFLSKYFDTKKIKIVPNWVERINTVKTNREEKKFLMVGRLEKQKNYILAFNFLEKLKEDYQIDIYGSGTLSKELNEIVNRKNLKVNFLGNVDHYKLNLIYQNYKYYLITSDFEGNPKSMLEALNNGCIVIASNIPNNSEIIINEKNGILFADQSELYEKFLLLNSNNNLQVNILNNSANTIQKFYLENIVKTMFNDYETLVLSK